MADAVTAYNPNDAALPMATPALIEMREHWADDWELEPEALFVGGSLGTGDSVDSIQFVRRYGDNSVRQPWGSDYETADPWDDRNHWWVRVRMYQRDGEPQTVFVGRIDGDADQPHGDDFGVSGQKTFTARGPQAILDKIGCSRSWWLIDPGVDASIYEIPWLPSVNARDEHGTVVGNRRTGDGSTVEGVDQTGCEFFGGSELWNHRQFVEYVLCRYTDAGGPTWTLGGDEGALAALEELQEVVRFGGAPTALELIRKVIPPRLGLAWRIRPKEDADADADGFEVYVFSLIAEEVAFEGTTLAANPHQVRLDSANTAYTTTRIARSAEQQYSTIRVFGKRAVACLSTYGAVAASEGVTADAVQFVGKWDEDAEDDYRAGVDVASGAPSLRHDAYRENDKFRDVFAVFAIDVGELWGEPTINSDGSIDVETPFEGQMTVRRTLKWTPLRSGWDYTTDEPTDNNQAPTIGELLPPQAWVLQGPQFDYGTGVLRTTLLPDLSCGPRYVAADELGLHVSPLEDDWGLRIRSSPNHLLAKNHWDSPVGATNKTPLYDYEEMVQTFAVECDQRIYLEYETEDGRDDLGVMEIAVDDAELWLLMPETVVGCPPDLVGEHNLYWLRSPSKVVTLRDDRDRLAQVMAGAIARYRDERARATVAMTGFVPAVDLIGQILDTVQDGDVTHKIGGAITSLEFRPGGDNKPNRTIFRTGFAQ